MKDRGCAFVERAPGELSFVARGATAEAALAAALEALLAATLEDPASLEAREARATLDV